MKVECLKKGTQLFLYQRVGKMEESAQVSFFFPFMLFLFLCTQKILINDSE